MSKSLKAIFAVLLIVLVSTVLLQNHRLNIFKSARAAETSPAQASPSNITQERLQQLLWERKSMLDDVAALIKIQLPFGRGTLREYSQAKQTALLAGIDLCETKEERISIYKEIVQLQDPIDTQVQMEAEAGVIGSQSLAQARLDRLASEIDLLREQLM
jgi:hypothetical protein